jgi:hypothetical protein
MRIAYLVPFRGGRETGIFRKVAEHAEEWTRLGATVGLFVGTGKAAVDDWSAIPSVQHVVAMPEQPVATLIARETLQCDIRAWNPDVVYVRHGLVHPGLIWTAMRKPLVIEINSNDVGEFAATSRWRSSYSRTTRTLLLRRAAGLVFISGQLSRSPHYDSGPEHRVAIGNGIRLADHPPFPAPSNGSPRLVFIGHPNSTWHGLDHLLEMASAFPEWEFDLIGSEQSEVEGAPENVTAHGTLLPEAYRPILERADVAVGSLALYRNDMAEGSPLKVREYLARGIPTIIGYQETDFMDPPPFLLQVPDAPDGVMTSLRRIEAFVGNASSLRVPPAEIQHIDVAVKEAQRLEFIESAARPS